MKSFLKNLTKEDLSFHLFFIFFLIGSIFLYKGIFSIEITPAISSLQPRYEIITQPFEIIRKIAPGVILLGSSLGIGLGSISSRVEKGIYIYCVLAILLFPATLIYSFSREVFFAGIGMLLAGISAWLILTVFLLKNFVKK